MGTLSRGLTFGAAETVTNTKLHNLVDLGSVTAIVNADIASNAAIEDTKLADITTGSKVNGSAITGLGNVPSGGGTLPVVNGGTGLASYTIGDIMYASGATALSKLAGVATGNVLLSGGVGTAPSWGKVGLTTHISGNLPATNINSGTNASSSTFLRGDMTWVAPGLRVVSSTTVSAATNSGNISFTSSKYYKVVVNLTSSTSGDRLALRFNNDTGAVYDYVQRGLDTAAAATNSASTTATFVRLTDSMSTSTTQINFYIFPQFDNAGAFGNIFVRGSSWGAISTGTNFGFSETFGQYNNSVEATSFRILSEGGNNYTGTIILYELGT